MNLDSEITKDLNFLSPLMNIINSILSLNFNKIFNSQNFSEEPQLFVSNSDIDYCFKVLVLDNSTFKFLSPLLKKATLKMYNICLITNINDEKDIMNNMMAIYLVTPSSNNFSAILKDMKDNIYQNYSINFIEKPDDNLLEQFLSNIIKLDIYKKIYNLHVLPIKYSLIHPKIIDFCSSDEAIKKPYSLFNLNLNDKTTENYYDLISNMLFNALFCMRLSPLIKFRNGSYSKLIAEKIQNKFISTFNKFPELKNEFKNGNCLLTILERDFVDIPIMFHHPSGYGALINDINGITFEQENLNLNKKNKINKFYLEPLNDFIWNKNITQLYSDVVDETLLKFKKYKKQMEILELAKNSNIETLENNFEKLTQSIKEIDIKRLEGDILFKHAQIYPVTNIIVDKRHLAQLCLIEKKILEKREINGEINNIINDFIKEGKINKENNLDIFRLCLIYFLLDKDLSNEKFIKDIIQTLKLPPKYDSQIILEYLKLIKYGIKSNSAQDLIGKLNSENSQNKTMLGQVGGVTKKLFKKGFNFIKNAVNNLTGNYNPAVAMDFLYDLIYQKNRDKEFNSIRINEDIYVPNEYNKQNVFLFFLGGGSLNEFEYCKEYMEQIGFNFIYGADKIYSPIEFLDEINELAKENMQKGKI